MHNEGPVPRIVMNEMPINISALIISDKQWLEENLLCYLSNAIQYSPQDSTVSIEISLNLQSSSPFLRIEVADCGIGVLENSRNYVFRPSSESNRQSGGSGFGLFCLSKRLEALGGRCGVVCRRDGFQGAEFWIEISYQPTTYQNTSHHFSPKLSPNKKFLANKVNSFSTKKEETFSVFHNLGSTDQASEAPSKSSLKILLVEDTPSIAKMCSMVLKKDGHVVHHSMHGADALLKLNSFSPFDVVLMDIQMPVMDGLEATRKIRKREILSDNRQFIIGCSANSDSDTIQDAFDAGVDLFMSKPFTLETFYQNVNNHPESTVSYEI
jgi:CheY-like chemotaxis protein